MPREVGCVCALCLSSLVKAFWGGLAAKVRQTKLTENFGFEDYLQQHGRRVTPLFAFNAKKRLFFFTAAATLKPETGWTIVALVQDDSDPAQAEAPTTANGSLDENRLPS